MTKSEKIKWICAVIFTGFVVSVVYHISIDLFTNLEYPYNTLFFRPEDQFGDFLDNFNVGRDPYSEFKASRAMMPFFVLLCRFMYFGVDHRNTMLAIYIIIFLCGLAFLISSFFRQETVRLRSAALAVLMFCSYPVLISLDRANFENGIFMLVFASFLLSRAERYIPAGILMGIAIAIKPYSIFFLPIFLINGQIVPILLAGGIALVLSVGSLYILPLSLQDELNALQMNFGIYNDVYVTGHEGLYFGTSIFGAVKVIAYWVGRAFNLFTTSDQVLNFNQSIQRPYFYFTNLIFMFVVLALLFYKTRLWKKAAILSACVALLPFVGSAYRLLYFFIPLMLFVGDKEKDRKDKLYAILFGLIMIPTSYIHFSFPRMFMVNPGEANDSVLFHPVVITILLVSLLADVLQMHELNNDFVSLITRLNPFALQTGKKQGEF